MTQFLSKNSLRRSSYHCAWPEAHIRRKIASGSPPKQSWPKRCEPSVWSPLQSHENYAYNYSLIFALDIRGGKGPASALFINSSVPRPKPAASECLVRVKAFGLNRADTLQRQGAYPPLPGITNILGLEFSGVVEEVGVEVGKGEETHAWKKGDEVFGLLYGGGYAEYVVVHEGMLIEKPKDWSWEYASGLSEVCTVPLMSDSINHPNKLADNKLPRSGSQRFKPFILWVVSILHVCDRFSGTQELHQFLLLVSSFRETHTVTQAIKRPQPRIHHYNRKFSLRPAQTPNVPSA